MNKNEKISSSLKEHFAKNGHHKTGKPGKKHSAEDKQKISEAIKEHWKLRGTKTEEQKKAGNKANVYAYRARKRNAVPADADLALIRKIYENCPAGFEVDHIIALAAGGLHHQDNLQYLPASENKRKGKNREYDSSLATRWQDVLV